MKRIIAAFILLIFVSAAYFGGYFFVKNTCKTANEILEECSFAFKNEPIENLVRELRAQMEAAL